MADQNMITVVSGNEDEDKLSQLVDKVKQLKTEKKNIQDEFNVQRAKMKDLFLQKEEEFNNDKSRLVQEMDRMRNELDDHRSQLLIAGMKLETDLEDEKRKASEEIATLQQLVQETVDESSSSRSMYDSEVRKLHVIIKQLQDENRELKSIGQQSSPHHHAPQEQSLAPSVMLSAVTKSLVRKLGADTFSSQDNLEESMRKAQEDAEMLRSLVVPLEEEIKALKDKLRSTDDQLQKCKLCCYKSESSQVSSRLQQEQQQQLDSLTDAIAATLNPNEESSTDTDTPCDMCSNYEAQLVREQQRNLELEGRLAAVEKGMERHKEDLLKEIGFRKDMEEKWNEKKEEHKQHVTELNKKTLSTEQDLNELKSNFTEHGKLIQEQLATLMREREQVYDKLTSLQKENDHLVGKYSAHSEKLQSETINIPDTIEELQEKVLRLQEDLIIVTIGKETALENQQTLQGDIILLRDQISELMVNDDETKKQNEILHQEIRQAMAIHEKFKINEKSIHEQFTSVNNKLIEALRITKQFEETNNELRSKVSSLQRDLGVSEAVQKDFVRLSQSLQVQLEKIRASDIQVRWQHEDDIEECPNCRSVFSGPKKKQHCRHCGQVFCTSCLNKSVPSGPKQRAAHVCDVCHTLLVKSSAPYFSTEPPHSHSPD